MRLLDDDEEEEEEEDEEDIIVPVYPVSSLSSRSAHVCGVSPASISPAGISMQTRSSGGLNWASRRMCGIATGGPVSSLSFEAVVAVDVENGVGFGLGVVVVLGISAMTMMPTLSADTPSRSDPVVFERRVGTGRVARSAASYSRGLESGAEGCVYLSLLVSMGRKMSLKLSVVFAFGRCGMRMRMEMEMGKDYEGQLCVC